MEGVIERTVTEDGSYRLQGPAGMAGRQGVHRLRVIVSDGELTWQCHKQILT